MKQTMKAILGRVAEEHRISVADLRSPARCKRVSHPRQRAMAEMIDAGFSTTQIGRYLGRDHTTVIFGAAQHRQRSGAPQ